MGSAPPSPEAIGMRCRLAADILDSQRAKALGVDEFALALRARGKILQAKEQCMEDLRDPRFKKLQPRPQAAVPVWRELGENVLTFFRSEFPNCGIYTQYSNVQNLDLEELLVPPVDKTRELVSKFLKDLPPQGDERHSLILHFANTLGANKDREIMVWADEFASPTALGVLVTALEEMAQTASLRTQIRLVYSIEGHLLDLEPEQLLELVSIPALRPGSRIRNYASEILFVNQGAKTIISTSMRPMVQMKMFLIVTLDWQGSCCSVIKGQKYCSSLDDIYLGRTLVLDVPKAHSAFFLKKVRALPLKRLCGVYGPTRSVAGAQRSALHLQLAGTSMSGLEARLLISLIQRDSDFDGALLGDSQLFRHPDALVLEVDEPEVIVRFLEYLADVVLVSRSKALILPKEEYFHPHIWKNLLTKDLEEFADSTVRRISYRPLSSDGSQRLYAAPATTIEVEQRLKREARLARTAATSSFQSAFTPSTLFLKGVPLEPKELVIEAVIASVNNKVSPHLPRLTSGDLREPVPPCFVAKLMDGRFSGRIDIFLESIEAHIVLAVLLQGMPLVIFPHQGMITILNEAVPTAIFSNSREAKEGITLSMVKEYLMREEEPYSAARNASVSFNKEGWTISGRNVILADLLAKENTLLLSPMRKWNSI